MIVSVHLIEFFSIYFLIPATSAGVFESNLDSESNLDRSTKPP